LHPRQRDAFYLGIQRVSGLFRCYWESNNGRYCGIAAISPIQLNELARLILQNVIDNLAGIFVLSYVLSTNTLM
jgi:hypothetical protein